MAENIPYSHHDIKRYLQQQMSPGEMHAFEKALMDDPFLSEALEGYRNADWQLSEQHLAAIESDILKEKNEGKVIPFIATKTSWWQVAAIVLVMATGGILTYSVLHKPTSRSEQSNAVVANKMELSSTKNDSIKADEKPLANADIQPQPEVYENKAIAPPMVMNRQDVPMASLNKDEAKAATTDMESSVASPAPAAAMANDRQPKPNYATAARKEMRDVAAQAKQPNEFKGQVTTTTGEVLAGASVKIADKNIATATDENGKFILKSNDSTVKVDVNTVGYATAKVALNKNDADKKITLQPGSSTLNEVVVTGYGMKRNKAVSASAAKVLRQAVNAVAEPVTGWNNYKQYLQKQVDSTLLADGKSHSNIAVEVEFSVNKKGEPVKLKALTNADKYYKTKAIYIVSHGPLWKPNNQPDKAKVQLLF